MDVEPEHELDFNRWYDREHLAERVAISGFVEARRYVAHDASPKYLSLYSTTTFEVLDSPAYRTALANQTDWSKKNIVRFQNMIRAVARITASQGEGRGGALGIMRIRPAANRAEKLRAGLLHLFQPEIFDGIISIHLLESDPALSRSLTDPGHNPGGSDWFILIDATSHHAVAPLLAGHFSPAIETAAATVVSSGRYTLLFDLAAADLRA